MIDTYRWSGGTENCVQLGAGSRVTLLVLPALFEEANRMRRFTVAVMRCLARQGIGTILPDLPGTGESLTKICDVSFTDWKNAVSTLSDQVTGSIAIRGGALLDGAVQNRWHLAPENGNRLLRDLTRATAFSAGVSASELQSQARNRVTCLAGNFISPSLFSEIEQAVPRDGGFVSTVDGPKLWRAAEPTHNADFARRVADDITIWVQKCAE